MATHSLQYSCLENPKDRGAWQATVHGAAKSWTRLSTHTFPWLCRVLVLAYRVFSCNLWDLVPRPEIEFRPPALGAWSLSHWTNREVPSGVQNLRVVDAYNLSH